DDVVTIAIEELRMFFSVLSFWRIRLSLETWWKILVKSIRFRHFDKFIFSLLFIDSISWNYRNYIAGYWSIILAGNRVYVCCCFCKIKKYGELSLNYRNPHIVLGLCNGEQYLVRLCAVLTSGPLKF